jgi:4-hydroxybenzoate polyprenyltransferase
MDELKDRDLDRALFPERPLPSGRVRASDLTLTLALLSLVYIPLHGPHAGPVVSATIVLGFAFLMFRWFFLPHYLRPRLLPTLATHNPIVGLLLLHLTVLFVAESGLDVLGLRWSGIAAVVALLWAPAFAWEIARKIRAPAEETAYVTYSRVLGSRRAVGLAILAQATAVAASLFLFAVHGLSLVLVLLSAAGFAGALVGHLRFLGAPCARTSRLAPFAEAQLLATLVGGCLA